MDSQRKSMEKKHGEVVLNIAGEGQTTTNDPNLGSLEEPTPHKPHCPSPEISTNSSPSARKPPKPPQSESLLRRRSIPTSALGRPKSRFVERTVPSQLGADPVSVSSTPRAPREGEEEDDDEEEIFSKEHLHEHPARRRRFKLRTLLEWAILVLSVSCLVASLVVDRLQGYAIWGLEIWKWCLMVAVTCCGHLFTRWLINLLVFMIERNFLLKKKVLYFVYGLKKSVQVFLWLTLVLLSWLLIFNRGVSRSERARDVLGYVSRLLISMLIGSVIWLVKTLLVKMLASTFHMNKYFDRIQVSIFHQYLLQTLSGPPLMELAEKVGAARSSGQLSFTAKGKGTGKDKEVIDVAKLHKMKQGKVSAWTMKGLINVIGTSGLSTLSNTIDETFQETGEHREITNELDAKIAAYRIFKNVAKPGCKYIDAEDLLRFLSKEEVEYVVPLFEGALETGKIKKSALRNCVVKAYLDRKALAHSLNDTKTAVKQLHRLATAIVVVAILIITLILLGIATTQVLVFISSQFLLVAFMFGNTCKMAFEAIIFVFVMHPFDVGDRCVVDGIQMTVEEMNILTTVFLKFDNEKIYYPNSVLSTKPISNFYRSPDMSDAVEFSVHLSTSGETIGALKERIKRYLESKPNHWHPNHSVVVKGIVNVNKLDMALYVNHTMNFQNVGEKNSRRSELVLELKKIFEDLSIQYRLLPQEVRFSYTGSGSLPVAISNRSIQDD
ncbi:mechanosensitive ion channel protein 10-like [Iris pallida]|uniref:Mechanosensitive ion channel protein n=1 Tax=Iris pallida TaxID=29817 RepID=A0AAX6F8C1_IRIPA|nr:mechanosensitive ion channel protein 10-like [Iris pallida]